MRNGLILITLILVLVCVVTATTALSSPLKAKAEISFHFRTVLVPVVVEEGHEDGNVLVSDTIKLTYGLKMVE